MGTSLGDGELCGGHLPECRETAYQGLAVFLRKTVLPPQLRIVLPDATGVSSGVLLPKFSHHGIGVNQFDFPTIDLLTTALNLILPRG